METIIQKALKLLLDKFEAEYDCVTVAESSGHYRVSIESDQPARLIGKNGQTLMALQTLLKNILWKQTGEKVFVSIDVDNYRKDREDKMLERVEKVIDTMRQRNLSEILLSPMSSYYRRIVHTSVAEKFDDLMTDSVGEGRKRAVKIFYK